MFSLKDSIHFDQRLAETIAWCRKHNALTDPKSALRTESLYPGLLLETRADTVNSVLGYRSAWLHEPKPKPVTKDHQLLQGRLVCYFPDANLADGASEVASKGFFDLNNAPPWDTWVGLYRADLQDISRRVYLIAYVPKPFLEHAQSGIEVNAEACIVWLYDSDTPIGNLLRSEGWQF
jgi:hypothetical protein